MKRVKLGTKVKDSITGLVGIAVSRTIYVTGCIHIGIQPPANGGVVPSMYWTDECRLSKVPEQKKEKKSKS